MPEMMKPPRGHACATGGLGQLLGNLDSPARKNWRGPVKTLSPEKARRVRVATALFVAGFGKTYERAFKRVHTLTAISWTECGCEELASYTDPNGSVDRGAFQLNSASQAGASDACAYDVECAARWVRTMWLAANRDDEALYNRWATYSGGKVGPLANPLRWMQTYRATRYAMRQLESA